MSDALGRVAVKVWVEDFEFGEDFQALTTPADLLAAVRVGVESGTIEGAEDVSMCDDDYGNHFVFVPKAGRYLVIPVSDGGKDAE